MADFSLKLDAEVAVQMATEALERHQLRVVRNFDLRGALQSQDSPCTCPHHGTADCKCNYVVLIAYDEVISNQGAQPAGKIVIHSHNGTTWLSIPIAEGGLQPAEEAQSDRRMLRAMAEVMHKAT